MPNTRVVQRSEFECAYLMPKDKSNRDYELNAHFYKIEATFENRSDVEDFVLDFRICKQIMDSVLPNNCFIYNGRAVTPNGSAYTVVESAGEVEVAAAMEKVGVPVKRYDFKISAETLAEYFALRIQRELNAHDLANIQVRELKLRETADSFATWSLV